MGTGAEIVRGVFAALGEGDMATVASLLDEGLVFELGGDSRFAGRHEGRDAFFQLQGELAAATEIQNDVLAVHDIEGGAIVHQRGTGRDGYEDEALLLFTVTDGRIVAVKEFLFDHRALDEIAPRG
jgi:ketosteroid isomerase-like protein